MATERAGGDGAIGGGGGWLNAAASAAMGGMVPSATEPPDSVGEKGCMEAVLVLESFPPIGGKPAQSVLPQFTELLWEFPTCLVGIPRARP